MPEHHVHFPAAGLQRTASPIPGKTLSVVFSFYAPEGAQLAMPLAVLNGLLEPRRLQRLIESQAAIGAEAYTLGDLFSDAHAAVWSELRSWRPVDEYRRNLQRGYVERLNYLMTQELPPIPPEFARFITATLVSVAQSDIRAYARGDLEQVKREATAALTRITDRVTGLHLRDIVARVDRILDPKE